MARKDPPQPLSAQTNSANNHSNSIGRGPQSATSLKSPTSPRPFFGKSHSKSSENIHHKPQGSQPQLPYPETSMMPASTDFEMSQSDGSRPEHQKVSTPPAANSPQKNSFFGFNKSKSSNKLQQNDMRRPATRDQPQSRDNDFQLQQSATSADIRGDNRPRDVRPQTSERNLSQNKSEPQLSRVVDGSSESRPFQAPNHTVAPKKSKPKGFGLLRRTNSTRNDLDTLEDGRLQPGVQEQEFQEGIRTAPIREDQDPTFREALNASNNRNHSADRQRHEKPEQNSEFGRRLKDSHRPNQGSISLPKEASSSLMNSIKGAGSKAANKFFGKSHEKDGRGYTVPEQYVPKLVNLPLIEQTRATRISKMLETSRDKTEYWMPSLPWRCIDYLNYRGTDQEGLYRVPGSGREVTKYQERFDTELDVDLFQERDLYDINIIGSLLKMWLRELPDELFPKEAQNRVSRATGQDPTEVPQILIDELSNLPPYNYYLLFALTCHLSLILEHSDKNRMSMTNLTICILPCMKMDATCFKLLVKHWRDCWKGCVTESEWMEKEIKWREGELTDLRAPGPLGMRKGSVAQGSERSIHERNPSSNSDSRPATAANASNERSRNVSGEDNNTGGYQGNSSANTNGGNNGSGSGGGVYNSKNPSREREQPSRLREHDSARLQTPPEIYAAPATNGRHDQLLGPIQPMSPMHMPGPREG